MESTELLKTSEALHNSFRQKTYTPKPTKTPQPLYFYSFYLGHDQMTYITEIIRHHTILMETFIILFLA